MPDVRARGAAVNDWLLHSGVQVASGPAQGGVRAGYDTARKEWLYVYPEISGYAISVFVILFRATRDERFRAAAISAADFLMRIQAPSGHLAAGAFAKAVTAHDGAIAPEYFAFDTAMCIQGLVSLFELTQDPEVLTAAQRAGNWLLTMQRADGAFFARHDAESGNRVDAGPYFYQDAGCLHAKHAVGLLQLAAVTGDPQYERGARRVCDWVLSLQDRDGAFWVNGTRSHVYTHAHCYATEGLLAAYDRLGNAQYGASVARACEWLRSVMTPVGIYGTHKTSRDFAQAESQTTSAVRRAVRRIWPRREIATDASLQTARIFRFRAARGDDASAGSAADALVNGILASAVYDGHDQAAKGGLHSRIETSLGSARKAPIIATWPVQFGAHACVQTTDRSSPAHVIF